MAATSIPDGIYTTLKHLYNEYRHTTHIPLKASFFSPRCMQVCRTMPNYAALRRETILQYLYEATGFQDEESYERAQSSHTAIESITAKAAHDKEEETVAGKDKVQALKGKSYYSIRPLKSAEESEILAEDIVAPLGMTASQLDELRLSQSWVGMRVDLWDDDDGKGRLIRVKYWWRKEYVEGEEKWLQCLHDIMGIGQRDGSEGKEGEVLE